MRRCSRIHAQRGLSGKYYFKKGRKTQKDGGKILTWFGGMIRQTNVAFIVYKSLPFID